MPKLTLHVLVFALTLAACSGDSGSSNPSPSPGQTAASIAPSPVATASTAASTAADSPAASTAAAIALEPTGKLSANDATISELTAAFEAAGISNARRWAREVDEYRPYEVDDVDYAKLRGELAKYNPTPGVVDAIIAELRLP